jgi:hypothetical protein
MIDEVEFERRVDHWFELVMKALEDNIGRAIDGSFEMREADTNCPDFLIAMEEADLYRNMYLPEEILAHYLDPLMPPGFFEKVSRADFLLQRGLAQHHAQRIAAHAIDMAKAR